MTTHQPPAQPVERTCFSCDRRLPASRFAGGHLGGKLVQLCDECRTAQQDYLTELIALSADMNRVHAHLTAIMRIFETRPPDGEAGSDEWADCYRAFQALHLATQLVHVARDNEQARRAPVPYLPVSYAKVAEYLAGGS